MNEACFREDLSDDLPFYLAGSLTEERDREIEAHLEICKDCSEGLVFWVLLFDRLLEQDLSESENYQACTGKDAEQNLIRFAERELNLEGENKLKAHLSSCEACRGMLWSLLRVRGGRSH